MPPATRAVRKAAKPAAHDSGKHLRRVFHHSSRVEILQQILPSAARESIAMLLGLASQELLEGNRRQAAHLLRGAEHLSFAALAGSHPDPAGLSPHLELAMREQFHELIEKAEQQWACGKTPTVLTALYESTCEGARHAFDNAAWHRALELARAAEALARVRASESQAVSGRNQPRRAGRGRSSLTLVPRK